MKPCSEQVKTCQLRECKEPFRRHSNESELSFRNRQYCCWDHYVRERTIRRREERYKWLPVEKQPLRIGGV